jgi:hypothetical protein
MCVFGESECGIREPTNAMRWPMKRHSVSQNTLLKIGQESAMQVLLNPVVSAPFSSLLAGCAQGELV